MLRISRNSSKVSILSGRKVRNLFLQKARLSLRKLLEKLRSSFATCIFHADTGMKVSLTAARVIAPERERRFVSANGLRRKTQLSRNQFLIFPSCKYGANGTIDPLRNISRSRSRTRAFLFFLSPFSSLFSFATPVHFRVPTILFADEIAVCAFEAARRVRLTYDITPQHAPRVHDHVRQIYEQLSDLISRTQRRDSLWRQNAAEKKCASNSNAKFAKEYIIIINCKVFRCFFFLWNSLF